MHNGCWVISCFAHSRSVCSSSAIFWIFGVEGGVFWLDVDGEDGDFGDDSDFGDELGGFSGSDSPEKSGLFLTMESGCKGEEVDPEAIGLELLTALQGCFYVHAWVWMCMCLFHASPSSSKIYKMVLELVFSHKSSKLPSFFYDYFLHASNKLDNSCKTHAISQIIRDTRIIEKVFYDMSSHWCSMRNTLSPLRRPKAGGGRRRR
ncbi:hypothetical protein LXL04_029382 [Taraxacum kok-saghyz]